MITAFAVALSLASAPIVRVTVEGEGFLRFAHEGHALYATSAPLTIVNGWLSNASGAPLIPTLRVPEGTRRVEVTSEGEVFASTDSFRAKVGRISLALFRGDSGLMPYGSYLVSSSTPDLVPAGRDGAGSITVLRPGDPMPANAIVETAPVARSLVPATDPFVRQWLSEPVRAARSVGIPVAPRPSGQATITVGELSETSNDQYTLGDIAVVDAEGELRSALLEVVLGDTPGLKRARPVRRDHILAELARAGFDPKLLVVRVPRGAKLRRTSQRVGQDTIARAAISAAEDLYGQGTPMRTSFRKDEVAAPLGEVSFEVESCLPTSTGASVIVVMKVNGERFSSKSVRVWVDNAAALAKRQDLH